MYDFALANAVLLVKERHQTCQRETCRERVKLYYTLPYHTILNYTISHHTTVYHIILYSTLLYFALLYSGTQPYGHPVITDMLFCPGRNLYSILYCISIYLACGSCFLRNLIGSSTSEYPALLISEQNKMAFSFVSVTEEGNCLE